MTTPLIEGHRLEKSFGRTAALAGVSVSVQPGEVVAITGPSGSGKSTLLLCLAGVLRPQAGEVTFDGVRLDTRSEADRSRLRRRRIGLVMQFGRLVPELTALQNVTLPLLLDRHDRNSAQAAAHAWLERMGAADVADALPGELSGGETQRVAVARALVTGPSVVLADEPTGALDTAGGEDLLRGLVSATADRDAALVLVTHDNRVAAHADREIVLRDGRTVTPGGPS